MKRPPLLARVGFGSWTLWVPVVLAWPLLLLMALPAVAVGAAFSFATEGTLSRFARFCAGLYALVCELRGTQINVDVPEARIAVAFY